MKLILGLMSVAIGFAVVALVLAGAIVQPAQASPNFAAQTGKPCGFCHGRPPELNAQGKKFKARGYKL